MTNEEKLAKARNFIRYLFRKMYDEFDVRFREDHDFFFDIMNRAIDIGVVNEKRGTYRLTAKEKVRNCHNGPRHFGKKRRSRI